MNIMSLRISGDGKEILAGTMQARLILYDLVAFREISKVYWTHHSDINSLCYANREHSNIIFTGGDDGLIKIWDKRALSNSTGAVGAFVGHAEGVTCVQSKGDGIYLVSNGKD